MGGYRYCVDNSMSQLQDVTTAYDKLAPILDAALGPIVDSRLFDELYVPMKTREYISQFASATLSTRAPTEDADDSITTQERRTLALDLVRWAKFEQPQVVYLLAPIGSGKSTFLYHLLRRELTNADVQGIDPIIIQVTGLEDPARFMPRLYDAIDAWLERNFPEHFLASCDPDIDTKVHPAKRTAFAQSMRREQIRVDSDEVADLNLQKQWLAAKKQSDPLMFFKQLISWANSQRAEPKLVILAIDNLDQHLATFGDQLLVRSHAAAEALGALLILPLRDTSYRANNGAFVQAAFRAHHLNLVPAETHSMLRRRLYMLSTKKFADQAIGDFVTLLTRRFGVTDEDERDAVRTRVASLVTRWVEPLSNRNRRQLLKMLSTILSSPHIVSETFRRSYAPSDDYQIPRENIFKVKVKMAMMLGRYNYYTDDARESVFVLNLFDCGEANAPWKNLVRLKLLQRLEARRKQGEHVGALIKLCTDALGEGARSVIRDSLGRFVEVGLAAIMTPGDTYENTLVSHPVSANMHEYMDRMVFLTHNGLFHLRELIFDDIYLDEMRLRSAMPDAVAQEVCKPFRLGHPSTQDERLNATKLFLQYLQRAESDNTARSLETALAVPPIMTDVYRKYQNREFRLDQIVR